MATLTDIRTQVTAVNATGRTNLAAKGVTVAQDADTATIMSAIATIPSGGAAPTVANSITWNGDTTGLDSHEFTPPGGEPITLYKVSNSVLPYGVLDGTGAYSYSVTDQSDVTTSPKLYAFDGYVALGATFDVVSAYFDNFESAVFDDVLVPSVGTWIKKDDGNYIKSVTAELDI